MLWVRPSNVPKILRAKVLIFSLGIKSSEQFQRQCQEIAALLQDAGDFACLITFSDNPQDDRSLDPNVDLPIEDHNVVDAFTHRADNVCCLPESLIVSQIVLFVGNYPLAHADLERLDEQCRGLETWLCARGTDLESCRVLLGAAFVSDSDRNSGESLKRLLETGRRQQESAPTQHEHSINEISVALIGQLYRDLTTTREAFLKEAEAASQARTEIEKYLLHSQKELGMLQRRLVHSRHIAEEMTKKSRQVEMEAQVHLYEVESAMRFYQEECEAAQLSAASLSDSLEAVTCDRDRLRSELDKQLQAVSSRILRMKRSRLGSLTALVKRTQAK